MTKNEATIELIREIGFLIRGLFKAGHIEQFSRIIFEANNDFFLTFPKAKSYFVLSSSQGSLKYSAFDDEKSAKRAIKTLRNMGDTSEYRIVSRAIAEMVGREFEFYQYLETIAHSADEVDIAHQKQKEIIDFIFSVP